MQIFVDADACPVMGIIETIAEKYNILTTLLCDTNHILFRQILDMGYNKLEQIVLACANVEQKG